MVKPIIKTKLHADVADCVCDLIQTLQWETGSQIPSELELSEEFEVSRSTIREAVKSLQSAGILRSRPGSGTYVAENALVLIQAKELVALMHSPDAQGELVQARYIVDPQIAALAAQEASAEEKRALLRTVETMETMDARDSLMANGFQFHMQLAEMAHNGLLLSFYHSIAAQLLHIRVLESLTLEVYRRGIAEHRGIAQAVFDGDADLAKLLMRRHLEADYAPYLARSAKLKD